MNQFLGMAAGAVAGHTPCATERQQGEPGPYQPGQVHEMLDPLTPCVYIAAPPRKKVPNLAP